MLKFVSDQLSTKKMCKKKLKSCRHKSWKMCDKAIIKICGKTYFWLLLMQGKAVYTFLSAI